MAQFFMGGETQEWLNLWLTRASVLLSFAAHLTLSLLAGIRRRRDSGVRRSLVRLAYYVAEIITPFALGKVFLDTSYSEQELKLLVDTATAYKEKQMFAFWAPFLLIHLGRPDNITSYALENKGLSPTQIAVPILAIGGAMYGSYKQGFMRGDGALRAAFFIMIFFGSYKCVERAVALHRASFANIRRSNEKKSLRRFEQEKTDDDDVLLHAHGVLGVTMGAFAEYKVRSGGYRGKLHFGWEDGCKVVEMEASLMYDLLYTKASVIHTLGGYIIRVFSPLATCTALYLFHSKEGKAMVSADLVITYILLVGTLVLDVRWLLRALGSTWTYAILEEDEEEESKGCHRWLKKAGRRAGRQSWYLLRRFLVSLDLARLALRSGPSGHRLLPGSGVGQCNLLHECSTPQVKKKKKSDAKGELLDVVYRSMNMEDTSPRDLAAYMMDNARVCSLETNILALHIATDIFLLCRSKVEREASVKHEKQIRAISDYMMFLLDQRRHMVLPPGVVKGSHCKKARLDLKKIWSERLPSGSPQTREAKELAINLLRSDRNGTLALGADWALRLLHELDPAIYGSKQRRIPPWIHSSAEHVRGLGDFILVFNGDGEAQKKLGQYRDSGDQLELLNHMLWLILVSWIHLLNFTANQCSRESHAEQLSRGGELLTIVWLMNQHKENGVPIEYV